MSAISLRQLLSAACIFSLGAASGVTAQLYSDSRERVEQHRADLSGAEHMEVIVSTAEYQPGDTVARHFHHGLEAAYIVQGATVEAPGKGTMTLTTGQSLLNLRDVRHAGFVVSGDTALKLFTVHIVDKDQPLYDYAD